MPRGRRTKASTTTKRPNAIIPDGVDGKDMDEETRRDKVTTLIKDFKSEISRRTQQLEDEVNDMLLKIDLACAEEKKKLLPGIHGMKFSDFINFGATKELSVANNELSSKLLAAEIRVAKINSDPKAEGLSTITELEEQQMAPETCRRTTRRKKKDEENDCLPPPATSRRGRKPRNTGGITSAAVYATPAMNSLATSLWATPMVTPKFDPRLLQTPAGWAGVAMRVPKAGEVIMSMEGSPLMNEKNAAQAKGILLPVNNDKMLIMTADTDISSMDVSDCDPATIQSYIKSLQTLQEKLNTITKFSVKATK